MIVLAIICCFLSACSFYRVDNEKRLSGNTERAEEQVEIHNGEEEHEEEPFSGTDTFSESVNTSQQQLYLEGEQAIDFRITMIGDSLTEGVGDQTNNGGYRYFLSKELLEESGIDQVQFGAFGKNGLTSAGLKKRLKEEQIIESVQNADIVIITIGGNDVMNVVKKNFMNLQVGDFYKAMDKYEANIKKIISHIKKYNEDVDIYLIGIYNPFQLLLSDIQEFDILMDEWNRRSNQVIAQYDQVYFVEIWEIFEDHNENIIFEGDYFHPNTRGYERMGEEIYKSVKENTISREQYLETE